MSDEVEVQEEKEDPKTKPMYKNGVEMQVSVNPKGRAILAKEGWTETKGKK